MRERLLRPKKVPLMSFWMNVSCVYHGLLFTQDDQKMYNAGSQCLKVEIFTKPGSCVCVCVPLLPLGLLTKKCVLLKWLWTFDVKSLAVHLLILLYLWLHQLEFIANFCNACHWQLLWAVITAHCKRERSYIFWPLGITEVVIIQEVGSSRSGV